MARKNSNKNNIKYLPFCMAIGAVIGVAFNTGGIGIAIGISVGAFIDFVIGKRNE